MLQSRTNRTDVKQVFHFVFLLLAAFAAFGNIPREVRCSFPMELTPGAHRLNVIAAHPSGFFATNASVWFTNTATPERTEIVRDGAGNIVTRQWMRGDRSLRHIQTLSWDAKGRLYQVKDYNTLAEGTNGYTWFAVYDGLDRLLYTTWYVKTNGSTWSASTGQTNRFFYDHMTTTPLLCSPGPARKSELPDGGIPFSNWMIF